jgi:hypothetical protein
VVAGVAAAVAEVVAGVAAAVAGVTEVV